MFKMKMEYDLKIQDNFYFQKDSENNVSLFIDPMGL